MPEIEVNLATLQSGQGGAGARAHRDLHARYEADVLATWQHEDDDVWGESDAPPSGDQLRMPTPSTPRGRRWVAARPFRQVSALLAALLLFSAAALIGAPGAQALPKDAYWYSLLDLPKAWTITEGAGVTVAVVDTGVDARVGDLRGQVLPGLDLTGKDPGARRDDPIGADRFGHGTDMATLIAGTGKGAGLTGVAPKAKILPIDATATGSFGDADIARGVTWAVDHGAKVINLSIGGDNPCQAVVGRALRYAYEHDVIVVASAGDSPDESVNAPANCPGALAIGAVDAKIKPWVKSTTGPEVDFAAPGYALVNELLTDRLNPANPANSGTSQATAIAAGTFALLRAHFPSETARQIVTRALYNVHNGAGAGSFGTRVNDSLGYGMVLPRYALTEAPPAGAKNPIFDQWARDFAGPSGASSASASDAPSGSASVSTGASTGASSGTVPAASGGGGGGVSPVLVVVIALGVLAVVVAVVVVARRPAARGTPEYPPPPGPGR